MKWIFLPGLDGAGAFFKPFLEILPGEVEPVTIAFPADEKLGYAELLTWLLPQLPVGEPFLVVAESFSGPLAVRLAARRPEGMIGAVISASFVRNPLPRLFRHLPWEAIFRLHLPQWLVRYLLADARTPPSLYDLFYEVIRHSPPEVVAHRARETLQVDAEEVLRSCELPLLFLEGTSDRLIRRGSMKAVRRIRPDVPIIPIEGPHFLLQVNRAECLRAIEGFLRSMNSIVKKE